MVRSTIQRLGGTSNPLGLVGAFDDLGSNAGRLLLRGGEDRPLISGIGEGPFKERIPPSPNPWVAKRILLHL